MIFLNHFVLTISSWPDLETFFSIYDILDFACDCRKYRCYSIASPGAALEGSTKKIYMNVNHKRLIPLFFICVFFQENSQFTG